jgi:alpha-D-ribose 1-methylphosphonate 5-triphosphate synthase subunit PhnI
MGYTTVADRSEAVDAAAALAGAAAAGGGDELRAFAAQYPLLVDQVGAESGIVEPLICARAMRQANGDVVRAVSLVRTWAATLPRLCTAVVRLEEMQVDRRITPAFAHPAGAQYLGASLDYAQRLLDLGDTESGGDGKRVIPSGVEGPAETFPSAIEALAEEGLIDADRPAVPTDLTRTRRAAGRGALLQLLARGETGMMTALAYTAIRGYGQRQDPTLMELRAGTLPVRLQRPDGESFVVGEIAATVAEVTLYRLHDEGGADPRFTYGIGATPGRVERRAIAAAMLDAGCARAARDPAAKRRPSDDEEFITIALDGQEASGFVEHLKLPHYVTFTSDLDRVRAAQTQ